MAIRMVHFNHSPRKLRKLQVFKAIIPTGTIFGKPGNKEHEGTQMKSTVSTTSRRDLIFVVP